MIRKLLVLLMLTGLALPSLGITLEDMDLQGIKPPA